MKRNILTIFLASPGDLQEERQIVRDIVDRVNKSLSRAIGWHTELLGWEDTLPGSSRPQAIINKDVDSCQLFLGILWRRWGQETGKYSSGFEEEFVRAQDRRNKSGSPEIWIYFKEIDKESAKDPGDQLKKVLKFKDELIAKKELLFRDFSETRQFEKIIHDDLLQYVIGLSTKESEIISQEESILAGKTKKTLTVEESKSKEEVETYPPELLSLFSKINRVLDEGKTSDLDSSDLLRLYLQSSAWFSAGHFWQLFGNHEINLAYMKRREWELSNLERSFLVRSFVGHKNDNQSGWYWLKEKGESEIDSLIVGLATYDLNVDVRRGALSLLVDIGFHANRDLFEQGIKNSDKETILNTIKLIRINGKLENIDLLEKVIENEDPNIKQEATSAKIDLLYLSKPDQGFSHLVESGSKITPLINNTLDDMSLSVDNKLLFQALKKADASVRRFSARYIRKSKLLTRDLAYELLKDTDPLVRKEGLLELIELNEDIDMAYIRKIFPETKEKSTGLYGLAFREVRAEDFIPNLLRKSNPSDLQSQLDFFNYSGIEAYKILAEEYFDIIESRIRSDLDDNFGSFKKESEVRFRKKYAIAEDINIYKEDISVYVRDKFIAAAIDGLAKNGNKGDIKYARQYLGNTSYNLADKGAISILSKFGDSSDVDRLIEAAKNNYDETQRLAIETAYNLAEDKESFVERLIYDENESIAKIGLQILLKQKTEIKIAIAKTLLKSEQEELRVAALAVIVNRVDVSELEQLLDDYISQDSYYYNIVTWLDRYLYSSGKYLQFYKTKLFDMVK